MINKDEQVIICKGIAKSCMWGHSGIASIIMEELDKKLPTEPSWNTVYKENAKIAQRESVGVITKDEELKFWLSRGYWLVNWDEDGCALFNPPPMNGLNKYVSKELANQYKSYRGF